MEVAKLVVSGVEIQLIDKPIGLESIKMSLDRDFQYSCIDTKIEAELSFYCASGGNELNAEYESKGIEASGYVNITDYCGANEKTYKFILDFKKYNNNGNYTTVGLIEENSLWKQSLNKEININSLSGNPVDFYVRNLPLEYDYSSNNVYAKIDSDITNSEHLFAPTYSYQSTPPVFPPSAPPTLPNSFYQYVHHFIMPRVLEEVNELEDSDKLIMDYFTINNFSTKTGEKNDISNVTTINQPIIYSEVEPTPLFTNINNGGEFTINTDNNQITIDLLRNITVSTELFTINEIICVGKTYANPRLIFKNEVYVTPQTLSSTTPTVYIFNYGKTFSKTFDVIDNESVWVYYHIQYKDLYIPTATYNVGTGLWDYNMNNVFVFDAASYSMSNEITATFKITKNTNSLISTSADIEPYHSKTLAYQGAGLLNSVFGTDSNLCNTDCFVDLWFSRGDYLRQKINVADFIVKPSDFFRELEKVVCCGLGYFYDSLGNSERKLMSIYDFYTDNLVPSQYHWEYNDLIDGVIELSPFLSPYYNEIQIGYSNYKDSPKDLCKQNNYSIDNLGESKYSKISDFIASQYVITRALRLGTEDKELEFDKNIFILSGTQDSGYNVTLSQTSGYLQDNVFVNPVNSAGVNRRYATLFNLFRHLYKWGFSLFPNKSKLTAAKYEVNTIYDYTIRDTTGSSTNPYYHGVSDCKLPLDNFENVDRSIEDIYTKHIEENIYVPTQITFKTGNLSTFDLIAMREHQYDLFKVTDGTNTYYGNLISATLENDITEIKLLRRFKDGI